MLPCGRAGPHVRGGRALTLKPGREAADHHPRSDLHNLAPLADRDVGPRGYFVPATAPWPVAYAG